MVADVHKMILALNTFGNRPGSPAVSSLEPLRDLSHLFICCRIYLNDGGSLLTCPLISSPRETHGWMDASPPQTAASCHLTGGVWASLPISPFRNSLICVCSVAEMTGFLAESQRDHSSKNNDKRQLSQPADSQLFLLFSTDSAVIVRLFWPVGHSLLSVQESLCWCFG